MSFGGSWNACIIAGACFWPCSSVLAVSHALAFSAGALQKQQRKKLRAALAANDRVAQWLDTIRRQIEQGIEGADEKRVQLERVGRGHGSAIMSEREHCVLWACRCEGWCRVPGPACCETAAWASHGPIDGKTAVLWLCKAGCMRHCVCQATRGPSAVLCQPAIAAVLLPAACCARCSESLQCHGLTPCMLRLAGTAMTHSYT